jgi:diguanylate cyclase (GGDEF)-like protein/PAS domain S-box-containing protein
VLGVRIAVVAGAYFIGAWIGLRFAFENRNVTAFWPPTGIAVAALVIWGDRVLPGVAIGAFVANLTNGAGLPTAAAITVGNTLGPFVAVKALRAVKFKDTLDRTRDVLALFFIGGFAAMTVSATLGTAALWLTGAIADDSITSVWSVWWVGDAIGVALFAPLLLAVRRRLIVLRSAHPDRVVRRRSEGLLLILVTSVAAYGAFNVGILLPYVVFVPIVWASLRFEQLGAAMVSVLVAAIAVLETAAGHGPFTFLSDTENLVSLQTFNATVAFTSLLLATVIRERRRAERVLRSSEELYRKLFEQANDFVCIHDPDGRITYANAAAERITGYSRERLHAMTIAELVAPESLRVVRRMMHRQFAQAGEPLTYEIDVVGTSGRRVSLEVSTALVYDGADPAGVQIIGRDITTRRLAEEQLRQYALHDELTDLPNETLMRERIQYAMTHVRHDGTKLALLLLDLDGFRHLNESLGTEKGDAFLRDVGATLTANLSVTDSVARLRGDEFALLMAPLDSTDAAIELARKLIRDVEAQGTEAEVSASVGITVFPGDAQDAATLLQQADVAMHVAKNAGGAGHAVYGPGQDQEGIRRYALQEDLTRAVATNDLKLLFQPKIAVDTLGTVGVECIVRWDHPRYGPIPASELDQMVQYPEMSDALMAWTLRDSLTRCRLWIDAGHEISVAVNVSRREIAKTSLVDAVRRELDQTGVPPERLLVEVAESDITDDASQSVLARLTDMGARLSVDHFGTGYSSLVHLRRLEVAEIKIDASFVRGLTTDDEDKAIAHSIIKLGHNIGIPVLADGIETRETWTRLIELGCDLAQGPLICEPVPAAQLESWLRTPSWTGRVG